ncbi:MAG: GNAT family N-acetyltransferase [Bacteroidota bacterium]
MIEIYSERLRLIPLDNQLLEIWQTQGRNAMETRLGLEPSNWLMADFDREETEDALINFWLPMTDKNQGDFFWFTNWDIVLETENISIGGIGFAGFPDQDGVTMVGYFIDGNYREKGYATEALTCLIDWAKLEPALKIIIADTPFFNFPSQNVLKKVGFKEFSISETEHIDQKIQLKNWKLVVK